MKALSIFLCGFSISCLKVILIMECWLSHLNQSTVLYFTCIVNQSELSSRIVSKRCSICVIYQHYRDINKLNRLLDIYIHVLFTKEFYFNKLAGLHIYIVISTVIYCCVINFLKWIRYYWFIDIFCIESGLDNAWNQFVTEHVWA